MTRRRSALASLVYFNLRIAKRNATAKGHQKSWRHLQITACIANANGDPQQRVPVAENGYTTISFTISK